MRPSPAKVDEILAIDRNEPHDIVPMSNRLNDEARAPAVKIKNEPLATLKVSLLATGLGHASSKVRVIVDPATPVVDIAVIVFLRPILFAVPLRNSTVFPI